MTGLVGSSRSDRLTSTVVKGVLYCCAVVFCFRAGAALLGFDSSSSSPGALDLAKAGSSGDSDSNVQGVPLHITLRDHSEDGGTLVDEKEL